MMRPSLFGLLASVSCIALGGASSAWAQQQEPTTLTDIVVTGSQVSLPPAYAGGQVATGERVGVFGALNAMDTPFSSTSFTEELARNQQARSVADVLQNDPAVRLSKGFGNFQELYVIRGFPVFSDDMAYNGLYGLLPRQYVASAPKCESAKRLATSSYQGSASANFFFMKASRPSPQRNQASKSLFAR
jgi:iron complex outermembrane receptor protein